MTPKQALAFVKTGGIVLEAGRGPVPSLADEIAGAPIRGSWWAHPKAQEIFVCSRAVRDSADVLVCRLVDKKVTYVHRRLWPALVRLAARFDAKHLAATREVHTPSGKHENHTTPYPRWVPKDVMLAAERIAEEQAASLLSVVSVARRPSAGPKKRSRNAAQRKPARPRRGRA
jgi:hypothetical protein